MLFVAVAVVVFLVVLRSRGSVGPFVWDGAWMPALAPGGGHHRAGLVGGERVPGPESVLAGRLANGEITPEDYLERLSLLQEK